MASKILSLDIGERFISCASVDSGNPPVPTVLAYEKAPVNIYLNDTEANEKSLIDFLQKILKDAAVSYKNTSLIIPDTRSYTRIFEMPIMTEKELISAIRYQADQFIPIPIDKVSMDIDILWEDKQAKKLTILLVAASNSLVDRLSKAVEKIGLVPLSLENETSASLKLFSLAAQAGAKSPNPQLFSLFLNFGFGSTSLCLFDNTRLIPLQMHNFSIGYDIFEKEIKANYSLTPEDAERVLTQNGFSQEETPYKVLEAVQPPLNELTSQIQRFVLSVREKNIQIQNIFVYGEGATIKSFDARMSTSLGIPVSFFNPYSFFAVNNVLNFFKPNLPLLVPVLGSELP